MARRVFRWLGYAVAGLITLVVVAVGAVYAVSSARISKRYDVKPAPLAIPSDSATIARGRHLAEARLGCAGCHQANLAGGTVVDDAMFGRFVAPNLTRGKGGVGGELADEDWVRAVRHGVKRDGKPVLFMPSDEFHQLGAEELAAVIAYAKQVPPVDKEQPPSKPGIIARALVTFDPKILPAAKVEHAAPPRSAPAPEVSAQYGNYLANTGGCRGCHGPDLAGAKSMEPGKPAPANLTPAGRLGQWSDADFIRALREGKRPDGSAIDTAMPWQIMGKMTDDELRALYLYLKSLPAKTSAS